MKKRYKNIKINIYYFKYIYYLSKFILDIWFYKLNYKQIFIYER